MHIVEEADSCLGTAGVGVDHHDVHWAVHALPVSEVCVMLLAVPHGLFPGPRLLHPIEGLAVAHQLEGWGRRSYHYMTTPTSPLSLRDFSHTMVDHSFSGVPLTSNLHS